MGLNEEEQDFWDQLSKTPEQLEWQRKHEETMARLERQHEEIAAIARGEIEISMEVIDEGHGVRSIRQVRIDHRIKWYSKLLSKIRNFFKD